MKKTLSVILVLFAVLILAGCGKNSSAPERLSVENLVSGVSFSEGETKVSGVLCCPAKGKISFTLTEPKSIKGISFFSKGSEISAELDGVSVTFENAETLFGTQKGIENLFEIILSCFSNAPKKSINSQYKTEYPLGEAVITTNSDGSIKSIRSEKYSYTFTGMSESA